MDDFTINTADFVAAIETIHIPVTDTTLHYVKLLVTFKRTSLGLKYCEMS